MNGFTRKPRRFRAACLLWLGPVALGLGLANFQRADASAIHGADKADKASADVAGMNRTWSEYLLGGPSVWSSVAHPALNSAIESAMWKAIKSDPPPNIDAVVQFFLYKQSLDPARFDHYHPRVGAAMAKIKAELAAQSTTPPTATTSTATTPTDQAQSLTPPGSTSPNENSIPEPATILLAIGMAGYALWWRRRHA
jgi:PEP-CTERM motif